MDDCISRKKAIEEIKRVFDQSTKGKTVRTSMLIDAAFIQARSILLGLPSMDVRENVRAEWKVTDVGDNTLYARCSHCKREIVFYRGKLPTDFCPHCGAAMKKWEG